MKDWENVPNWIIAGAAAATLIREIAKDHKEKKTAKRNSRQKRKRKR